MLKIENLSVYYNTVRAVQEISFTVNEGEIVGIIGTNGSGKTTLMKAIAGLVSSNGRILFNGADLTDTPAHQRVRAGITLVPEGRHIFSEMTVLENLKTASNNKDDIYSVYNIFPDLKRFANKKAGLLSGGQQQMVAIARALLTRPKLILLDEMTMGLSPKLTAQMFDTIYNIGRNFSGVVITGQEAQRILAVSDRVYLMKTGRLTEQKKEDFDPQKIF